MILKNFLVLMISIDEFNIKFLITHIKTQPVSYKEYT